MITKEPTSPILTPNDTLFRIDCFLAETDYIEEKHQDLYEFSFLPLTQDGYNTIEEHCSNAETKVEIELMSCHHNKTIEAITEGDNGTIYVSQFFKPILNLKIEELEGVDPLRNRTATLTLHLRDAVDGKIYLQCEYIDFFEYLTPYQMEEWDEDEETNDF